MPGSDGVDMDTAGAGRAMSSLAAAGTGFDGSWAAATASTRAGEGQVGQGPMGQAFVAGYRPAAQRLSETASAVSRGLRQAADAGSAAVTDYEAADRNGAAGFGR